MTWERKSSTSLSTRLSPSVTSKSLVPHPPSLYAPCGNFKTRGGPAPSPSPPHLQTLNPKPHTLNSKPHTLQGGKGSCCSAGTCTSARKSTSSESPPRSCRSPQIPSPPRNIGRVATTGAGGIEFDPRRGGFFLAQKARESAFSAVLGLAHRPEDRRPRETHHAHAGPLKSDPPTTPRATLGKDTPSTLKS